MTRRARLVIAVTAATLLSSATAFADGWGGPGGHHGGGGAFGWPILRGVGLSDDQKAQIRNKTGKDADAVELSVEELEERIAPFQSRGHKP